MPIDHTLYDKLIRYCAYRERCEGEVRKKMSGLLIMEPTEYLKELREDGYLDDLRYARAFATGRFRLKYWGKRKIEAHLRQKGVSESMRREGLEAIDMEEYYTKAAELIEQKWEDTKAKNDYERKSKVYRYMIQKGYESGLVSEVLTDRERAQRNR